MKKRTKIKRVSKRGKNFIQFSNGILIYIPKNMEFDEKITITGLKYRNNS